MDCDEPVDDYCDASLSADLKISEKNSSTEIDLDQFYLVFDVETTTAPDDDEDEDDDRCLEQAVEDTKVVTFWAPCPRIEHENLTKDRISSMLSTAGVPRHKQPYMVDRIQFQADQIAGRNKDMRVLPIQVFISMVACLCIGESIEEDV